MTRKNIFKFGLVALFISQPIHADRVKDLVDECEKFAEESPYPEKNVMFDAVYEQEDYPFLSDKL